MNKLLIGALLVTAVSTTLGVATATAQSDSKKTPGIAAESIERFKDQAIHSGPTVFLEGWERGNLHELGVKELLTDANFEAALDASADHPVLIFKHSTECKVSGSAYRRIAQWLKDNPSKTPPIYLVKVIERKPVSENIEAIVEVEHESPQLILLDGGKSVWDTSHEAIDAKAIEKALAQLKKD